MILAALLTALASPAPQAPPGVDFELQQRIDHAIDQGTDALLRSQELDGSWRNNLERYPAGMTSLAVYTLLKCGLPPRHPAIVRAVAFLRGHEAERTYSLACLILALVGLGDPENEIWLEECVGQLLEWEASGYGYPDGATDLSNTQYAALALHAAATRGVRIPDKTWMALAKYALHCQERPHDGGRALTGESLAGFAYQPAGRVATGSMTACGVSLLTMAESHLRRFPGEMRLARDSGVRWLEQHFTVEHNPFTGREPGSGWTGEDAHLHYYLYGVERVGSLLGIDELGGRPWYAEGARFLVEQQAGNGLWQSNQPNTCFALLFLARATAGGRVAVTGDEPRAAAEEEPAVPEGVELQLRFAAKPSPRLWIAGIGEAARADMAWFEEDGGGVRVHRARFYARPPGEDWHLVAEVAGDPADPAAGLRGLAAPLQPHRPGLWVFRAEADLVYSGMDPEEEMALRTLGSPELQAELLDLPDPLWLEYAELASRNLLRRAKVAAHASSESEAADWAARYAVDGLQGTGWRSADDDPRPVLHLELRRPVKADLLLLSHAADFRFPDPRHLGRALRVEVLLNGAKKGVLAELVADDRRKSAIDLGPARTIRVLEIRVLESSPGVDGADGVGFNEIELLRK